MNGRFLLDRENRNWYFIPEDYKYDWAEWCDIFEYVHPGEEKIIPEYATKIKHYSEVMFSDPVIPDWNLL